MKAILAFALVSGLALAAPPTCDELVAGGGYVYSKMPANPDPSWPATGLPACVKDETIFYVANFSRAKYQTIRSQEQTKDKFYVRFDFAINSWIWVTAGDPRAVAPGSKLQGWRLGVPSTTEDPRGLDWYKLGDDWFTWTKVTDRDLPEIYRREFDGSHKLWQRYPDNWVGFGGEVDPLASDRPWCRITASPSPVKVRGFLTLHVNIYGIASQATIADQKVRIVRQGDLQSADLTIQPEAAGFFTATAKVTGPAGETTCEAPYSVEPAN